MAVIISILIFSLLVFGMLVDYVTNLREKQRVINKNKRVRLQSILFRAQRLLNGRSILPLTVVSAVVCLERTLVALNSLLYLKSTKNLQEVKAEVQHKLVNFRSLALTGEHFYSLLTIPHSEQELQAMLKQSILLTMTLKVDQYKGYVSIDYIMDELDQLSILKARLTSAIINKHAMQALESKHYDRALTLNDQAVAYLLEIKCTNENVVELVKETVEDIQLINIGIAAVIEEKSHHFYEKHKEEARQDNDNIHEGDDGLARVFDKIS
ncbi:MAG: hypothetical protein ACI9LM_001138 [Alteromonadaceae bacterium]|jgi:hypothetical protein